MSSHHYSDLIALFDACFLSEFNTRLVRGRDEPIYIPRGLAVDGYHKQDFHQIVFAHGFFRSALHEIAHWLVAGDQRRMQLDYGYWYAPDGRNAQQQAKFEQVEVAPQALEWILTKACAHPFAVSVDNLSGEATDSTAFKRAVLKRVQALQQCGLSARAGSFRKAVAQFYGTPLPLQGIHFSIDEL
ncbi:MAG TPA: elongation factor P hydroxylase [Marinagarivorans sp.]